MYFIYTTLILFAFWLVLSGKFDLFHLALGAISSLVVAWMSSDLLFFEQNKKGRTGEALRFIAYIPWLVVEIFKSTIHVAWLALHPAMRERIDPRIVTFKTRLKSDVARAALANSITLTPGTITVRIEEDVFTVHALSNKTAAGLPGAMEERIAAIFREEAG
ncbi:MAG: Na+/H+ antiporter subunit E [Desulfurivibrionaceae bacterium]